MTAAYSLEGALLPKVSSLQNQNVPACPSIKQCPLHSLPTPAGFGCELVTLKRIVLGELSRSSGRVVSEAWNQDPRGVPRCHQASPHNLLAWPTHVAAGAQRGQGSGDTSS